MILKRRSKLDNITVLANRTMSAFPLSIGTSLAFESLFNGPNPPYDPEREIPQKVDINDYKLFLINVDTLIRNIMGSVDTEIKESLSPKAIYNTLLDEINLIIDILNNEGQGFIKPYFYHRSYDFVKYSFHRSKVVRFYQLNTKKQEHNANQIKGVINLLKKDKNEQVNFVMSDLYIKVNENALILTHIPYDLLSYKNFKKLDLIESHTGILKTRKLYYTKFYDAKKLELENIPFQRKLLATFGDHVMFRPFPIKIRYDLIQLSKQYGWTAVTNEHKVTEDINRHLADLGYKFEYNNM